MFSLIEQQNIYKIKQSSSIKAGNHEVKSIQIWFILLVTLLAFNLWSLKWYPPVGMDDTFVSAHAHNFLNKGQFSQPMNRVITVLNESELMMGRLHLGGLALMGFLFRPSITTDRLWSWSMAMVSLALLWLVARSFLERSWAMASVALCLAEPMFFSWSHIPRPEMTMAAIFLLAVFCGMKAIQNKSKWGFLLAGLCCGFATEVHLTGIILVPSMVITLLVFQKKGILSSTHLGWFVGGALLSCLWFVMIHILPNPKLFVQQWDLHIFLNGVMSKGINSFFRQIINEYLRYQEWFWGQGIHRIRLLEGILIFLGIIFQIRSRDIKGRFSAVATLALVITMALIINRKAVYYLMPLYPLFVLHAVAALQSLAEIKRFAYIREKSKIISKSCKNFGTLGLIGLFVFYFSQDLIKLNKFRQTDYERYIAEITAVVPPGPVVAGSPSLWYGLGERNNLLAALSILWALDYEKFRGVSKSSVIDLIYRENIQYIVVEPYLRSLLTSQNTDAERSFLNFLGSECKLIKAFRNNGYVGVGECPDGDLTEVFEVFTQDPY